MSQWWVVVVSSTHTHTAWYVTMDGDLVVSGIILCKSQIFGNQSYRGKDDNLPVVFGISRKEGYLSRICWRSFVDDDSFLQFPCSVAVEERLHELLICSSFDSMMFPVSCRAVLCCWWWVCLSPHMCCSRMGNGQGRTQKVAQNKVSDLTRHKRQVPKSNGRTGCI